MYESFKKKLGTGPAAAATPESTAPVAPVPPPPPPPVQTPPPANTSAPASNIPDLNNDAPPQITPPPAPNNTGTPINTAPVISDAQAKTYARMYVRTLKFICSFSCSWLTGNPSERYQISKEEQNEIEEAGFEFFKTSSWAISPGGYLFLTTFTIFGMVVFKAWSDYKGKKIEQAREAARAEAAERAAQAERTRKAQEAAMEEKRRQTEEYNQAQKQAWQREYEAELLAKGINPAAVLKIHKTQTGEQNETMQELLKHNPTKPESMATGKLNGHNSDSTPPPAKTKTNAKTNANGTGHAPQKTILKTALDVKKARRKKRAPIQFKPDEITKEHFLTLIEVIKPRICFELDEQGRYELRETRGYYKKEEQHEKYAPSEHINGILQKLLKEGHAQKDINTHLRNYLKEYYIKYDIPLPQKEQ